jgi:hypothetical protein
MSTLIREFCDLINQNNEQGDVLEFGAGSGTSTENIASNIGIGRKIFTFDGFQGLPESNRAIPRGWEKGAYCYDENGTRERLKRFSNVSIHKTMTCDLKSPSEYGIGKIIASNMDMDLYEGTLDGLRFISRCEWNMVILRFDDWGATPPDQIAEEYDRHEKAAFFEWIEKMGYKYQIDENLLNRSENLQSIIIVMR